MGARTGQQFLDGLRKTRRTVWLGDERVDDVTAHPAAAGAAHTLAGVFDRQHRYADDGLILDPETGEATNLSHVIPRSVEHLKRRNRGLARISEATVGLMARTPDYMNVTAHQTNTDRSHPNRPVDSILAAGRAPEVPSNREGG